MSDKSYWLHRVTHECGHKILKTESRLTIGFSKMAESSDACRALAQKDYGAFCSAYTAVYNGDIERCKNGLWRFVVEMKIGDMVVTPYSGGFFICRIKGDAEVCQRGGFDLGWERSVEILADCAPRADYASAPLLSRMKCQQANLDINDLAFEVEDALDRKIKNAPFDIAGEVGKALHKELDSHCSPERFEYVVASYFKALGAEATVLSRNYSGKQGDCDVEAIFPSLKHTISVQCKKHAGTTDGWAVQQIHDYARNRCANRECDANCEKDNWTHAFWVVSLADAFNAEAQKLAEENHVVLINGEEFCRMLLSVGGI